ncbi:MAG TPA: LysM domain-containing protein [Solirubrobacteraceae bacterium]|nr:LysM domain-containing protein [Solirubrobacteraceae bacterium]
MERSKKAPAAPEANASHGAASPAPSASQSDSAPAPVSATQTAASTQSASSSSGNASTSNSSETGQPGSVSDSKTYVVRAGDSLWLIAKRLLSPGASNAEIAQLVNRLWTLNASRIRTGSPDLVGVGVVLMLP